MLTTPTTKLILSAIKASLVRPIRRSLESPFNAPSTLQSVLYQIVGNSKMLCPLLHIQCFAFICVCFVCSPVVRLLFPCCPSAVFWAVVAVVVDSLQSHSLRSVSHVRMKVLERILPSVAHLYTATTVVFVTRSRSIEASRFNCNPYSIFRSVRSSMRCRLFKLKTSTAFCHPASKIGYPNNRFVSAFANAFIIPFSATRFKSSYFL